MPISVLSAVARLFEKLVQQQLFPHLKDLLSVNQSGFKLAFFPLPHNPLRALPTLTSEEQITGDLARFKPGHSTETSLLNTTNSWLINMDKGYFNLTLFLDLRKAFDTVDHKILLKKLYYYKIANNDLAWFESYLSNRIQYCSIDGHDSEPKPNPAGIPQGSSLGPILFLSTSTTSLARLNIVKLIYLLTTQT